MVRCFDDIMGEKVKIRGEERQGTLTRACRLFHSVENYNEQIWKKSQPGKSYRKGLKTNARTNITAFFYLTVKNLIEAN